jgi:hypothetical protein
MTFGSSSSPRPDSDSLLMGMQRMSSPARDRITRLRANSRRPVIRKGGCRRRPRRPRRTPRRWRVATDAKPATGPFASPASAAEVLKTAKPFIAG